MDLDLADIQGGVLTAYGKLGFPKGRVLLFHIAESAAGRAFVEAIRTKVTSALRWSSPKHVKTGALPVDRLPVTLNLAFTFRGLLALQLPIRTLRGLPDEFIDGMAQRARILGDDLIAPGSTGWDEVWRPATPAQEVHLLVLLNAQADSKGQALPALDALTRPADPCDQASGRFGAFRSWPQRRRCPGALSDLRDRWGRTAPNAARAFWVRRCD